MKSRALGGPETHVGRLNGVQDSKTLPTRWTETDANVACYCIDAQSRPNFYMNFLPRDLSFRLSNQAIFRFRAQDAHSLADKLRAFTDVHARLFPSFNFRIPGVLGSLKARTVEGAKADVQLKVNTLSRAELALFK